MNFQELLKLAIGDRTQLEFARCTGLSKFHINRLLGDGLNRPTEKTLVKISEASEGRVSLIQLKHACGYPLSEKDAGEEDAANRMQAISLKIRHNMESEIAKPTCRNETRQLVQDVVLLSGEEECEICNGDVIRLDGVEMRGADYMQTFILDYKEWTMIFALFFCNTTTNRVIVMDSLFSLEGLMDWNVLGLDHYITDIMSETQNPVMSAYQTVYRKK